MACLFGHKWNGCTCKKCGVTRHQWEEKNACIKECKLCGEQIAEHKFEHCKCAKCGEILDRYHKYDKNGVCSVCGKHEERIISEKVVTITGTPVIYIEVKRYCAECGVPTKRLVKAQRNGHRFSDECTVCKDIPLCPLCGQYTSYVGVMKDGLVTSPDMPDATIKCVRCNRTILENVTMTIKNAILDREETYETRLYAARQVDDIDLANELFNNCEDIGIRLAILDSLIMHLELYDDTGLDRIENQNAFADIASLYKREYLYNKLYLAYVKVNQQRMEHFLDKVTDQNILARMYSSNLHPEVKSRVINSINDQAVLYELSKTIDRRDTKELVAKITDQNLLRQLAQYHMNHSYGETTSSEARCNLLDIYKAIEDAANSEDVVFLARAGSEKHAIKRDPFTDDHKY